MGQGCLPDNHPLMVGQTGFWGLEFTHSLTVNADVILGLGTRFAEADSSSWYRGVTFDPDHTEFLQIDIDPMEIGRNYPVSIGPLEISNWASKQILEEVKKICLKGKRIRNCVPRLPKRRKPSRKAMLPFLRMAVSL